LIITFKTDLTVEETMVFERIYPGDLQETIESKQDTLDSGLGVWMYANGELAGETYGMPAWMIDPIDDAEARQDITDDLLGSFYVSSTTILSKFQGGGLGKILKSYLLGYIKGIGYKISTGHATSVPMFKINKDLGAQFLVTHDGWYGTKKIAYFCKIEL